MKVFVTGVNGQVGHDVMNELHKRGHRCIGSDIQEKYSGAEDGTFVGTAPYIPLDITKKECVAEVLHRAAPEAVIHCAAWTNVDGAESEENRPTVYAINAEGSRNIAEACKALDAKLLYLSTDYVFDGQGAAPWRPDDDSYAPLNYYGETKLGGELAVSSLLSKYFIVRIAWVFGKCGKNFVRTMLKLSETHREIRVVNDQIGTPTYTVDLAGLLVDMIETEEYGRYHATNEGGYISWAEFAEEIMRQAGKATRIIPVTTKEYGNSVALRPSNSRLDKSKLTERGFERLPPWQDAVKRYLKEISEE